MPFKTLVYVLGNRSVTGKEGKCYRTARNIETLLILRMLNPCSAMLNKAIISNAPQIPCPINDGTSFVSVLQISLSAHLGIRIL